MDGSSSWLVFSLLDMDDTSRRLRTAANEWAVDVDLLRFRASMRSIKVTKDVAEEGLS